MCHCSRRLLRRTFAVLAVTVWIALGSGSAAASGASRAPAHPTGHVAGPAGFESLAGARYSPLGALYDASFDLRDLGKVSSVKSQSPFQTCWTFAAIGSLESCLLPGEPRDFSEDSLVWFHGFDAARPGGGNAFMATAQLTRWDGPFTEAQDPYGDGIHPEPSTLTVQKHVQDVMFLPPRLNATDNDNVKWAITTYGGVDASMYADAGMQASTTSAYWNETTDSYCYSGAVLPNHDVLIVGWDDAWPKAKFSTQPAGDGAFLVKNSWGGAWGDGGYFWVSYYDSRLGYGGYNSVFMGAEPTDAYTDVYQWDPLGYTGWTVAYVGTSTGWSANKFTADADAQLKAIGFYTLGPNASYEIFAGPALTSLTSYGSGTLTWFGYHTVDLSTPMNVSSGEAFIVAVKITTPDFRGKKIYPIVCERPYANYSSAATATSGQSYEGPNGTTWYDVAEEYPNTNVCVKAYTATDSIAPVTTAGGVPPGWVNGDVTITLSAIDDQGGSGMSGGHAKTEYSRDGGRSWTEGNVVTYLVWKRGGGSGVHTLLYRSSDAAGNLEEARSCTVSIDARPPRTTDDAPLTSRTSDVTVHFASVDSLVGVTACSGVKETWCRVDSGGWLKGTQVTVPSAGNLGVHWICYYSRDNAGNLEMTRWCSVTIAASALGRHAVRGPVSS
jgi:C1A family cysteine protease